MTAWHQIAAITDRGKGNNEDRVGSGPCAVWAIDGASPLEDALGWPTASEFAEEIHQSLTRYADRPWRAGELLAQVQRDVLESSSQRIAGGAGAPSAGVAVVSFIDGVVEAAVLGDVLVSLRHAGAAEVFHESPLVKLDTDVVQTISKLVAEGESFDAARKRVHPQLLKHRRMLNTPDGYGVMSPSVDGTKFIAVRSYDGRHVDRVCLATDGYARVVDFGIASSWDEVLTDASDTRFRDSVDKLRAIELHDDQATLFPRLSLSDDASAIAADLVGS